DRLRQLLEQSAVVGLDAPEGIDERVAEGVGVGKARQPGNAIKLVQVGRDDMRLLVADHLQPVLDAAEKEIGLGHLAGGLARNPAAFSQAIERLYRTASPEFRVAASGNELLGLGEELDIADAASSKLDVVALYGDGAMAFELVHSALHRVDVGDSGVVEIFAPDERRELAQKLLARLAVARSDSRFDERSALPVLTEALVVGEACIARERDLRCPRIRAQTKIGAKHVAVRGVLLEKPHQLARQF